MLSLSLISGFPLVSLTPWKSPSGKYSDTARMTSKLIYVVCSFVLECLDFPVCLPGFRRLLQVILHAFITASVMGRKINLGLHPCCVNNYLALEPFVDYGISP